MRLWWLREGLIYGLAGVLAKFTGFFLAPIFTRVLTTTEYGLLDLATVAFAVLLLLAESQLPMGVMREYQEAKNRDDRGALIGSVLIYYLFSYLIVVLLVWLTKDLLAEHFPGFDHQILLPVLVGILPMQFVGLVSMILRLEQRPWGFLLLSVGQIVLGGVCGTIALLVFDAGVPGILWGFALSQITFGAISLVFILHALAPVFSMQYTRGLLGFCLPIVLSAVGGWVQTSASRFFIVGALSLSALGVYSIAFKIASVMLLMDFALKQVWGPYAFKKFAVPGSEIVFVKALNICLFSVFGVAVIVTTVSPILLWILAPEEYWGAAPFVGILAMAYVWHTASMLFAAGNFWARKTAYNAVAIIAADALSIALLWWGTSKYGLLLVSIVFLASKAVGSLALLWTSQRNHYIPYSMRAIVSLIVLSVAYPTSSYLLSEFSQFPISALMLSYLAIGGAFLVMVWFSVLRREDKDSIRSMCLDGLGAAKRAIG